MKQLKLKHDMVKNQGRQRSNNINAMSPIRGKMRPKSAPSSRNKDIQPSTVPYNDGYEQRPVTSRVVNYKNNKNNENALLRDTVKFTEKIQVFTVYFAKSHVIFKLY